MNTPLSHIRSTLLGLSLVLALGEEEIRANPGGGTVAQGAATISSSGNVLTVTQGTDRAVVNWNSFSVGAGEVTRFVQPSSSSAILNRVTGGSLSQIAGSIEANGQVYLLNPNGIVFGAGSTVNTAGFLASTLNAADTAFMAGGDLHLTGESTSKITNLGSISAGGGNVYLIAKEVENRGTISAPNGEVGLAGATDVLLASSGTDRLLIRPGSGQGAVTNTGTVEGAVATLKAVGGNEYALAINNGGVIRATGTQTVNGRVLLFADGGTTKNTGTITAADADGRGGQIETSGAEVLLEGTIATAPGGTWLVDPTNLTIDATAATTIVNALNAGTNVTEQTTATTTAGSGTTASGSGDITVASALSWTGTGTLTLDAYNNIYVNANISASNTSAGLTLSYGSNAQATGAGYFLGGASSISLPAGTANLKIGRSGALKTYTVVTTVANLVSGANGSAAGYFALGSNAAATSYTADPIAAFSGTLDGLGHTITGLTLSDATDTSIGFVGVNSGTIQNLGLSGVSVTSTKAASVVGSLVGRNTGTISASWATGTVSGATATNVGGLVGAAASGSISSSFASASVSGTSATTVGGLVGTNGGAISNSYSIGTETGSAATTVGALAGTNTGTIATSYAYETVNGTASGTVYGASASAVTAGLSLAKMTASSSYAAPWTFTPLTGTWGVNGYTSAGAINNGLPYLQWQAPLTQISITAINQNVVYGSALNATATLGTTYTASGTVATYTNGNVALALSGTNVNAGTTNFILPSATVKAGATVEFLSGVETITAAPLTITASAASKTYGAEQALTGYGVTGLKYSDAVTGLTLTSAAAAATANVGTYSIAASAATGVGLSNYTITYVSGSDVVNPASLTVKAGNASKTYGSAQTLRDYSVTGLVNGDSVRSVTLASAGAASAANAGSYAITVSGAAGTGLSNYSITYLGGTDTVNPATLTYVAAKASRAYGVANPALGGTVTGFVLGQTAATATTGKLTFTTAATKNTDALTAAIAGSGLTANNGNYVFVQAAGNATALTIVGAPLPSGQIVQVRDTAKAATASATVALAAAQTTKKQADAAASAAAGTAASGPFGDTPFSTDGDTVTVSTPADQAKKAARKADAVVHAAGLPETITYAAPPEGGTSGTWYSYLPNVIYGTSSGAAAAQPAH